MLQRRRSSERKWTHADASVVMLSGVRDVEAVAAAAQGLEGVAFREDEKPRLQADLGDKNFLMLRNHGLLTVGKTIADSLDLRRDWFEPSHHVAATQNHGQPNRLYSR